MTSIDEEKSFLESELESMNIPEYQDTDQEGEHSVHEPTNSELLAEIQKNRQLIGYTLFFSIITLLIFLGVSYYLYNIVISYKAEIDEAFETMKKIDAMVEQLEADYGGYSRKIDDFFKTVDELKANLDNLNRVLGSLSNLRLPF